MDAMSKTLNEMVHAIVDYCGTITRAADEIGVHYNTLDRLLKDETATTQTGTMEKIEAIYEEIALEEEPAEEEIAEEELTEEPVDALTIEGYEATLGSAPTIIGTTPAERLHSCLYIMERCNRMIAAGEKAKRDKAAILPLMDEIYKEFRS